MPSMPNDLHVSRRRKRTPTLGLAEKGRVGVSVVNGTYALRLDTSRHGYSSGTEQRPGRLSRQSLRRLLFSDPARLAVWAVRVERYAMRLDTCRTARFTSLTDFRIQPR